MNPIAVLISSIGFGLISAYLANRKGRNPYTWFTIGFIFGLLGVLALFILPQPRKKNIQPDQPIPSPQPFIDGPSDRFWYYLDEARASQGPMSHNALTQAWQNGSIGSSTFVWHEELSTWKPLQELIKYKV